MSDEKRGAIVLVILVTMFIALIVFSVFLPSEERKERERLKKEMEEKDEIIAAYRQVHRKKAAPNKMAGKMNPISEIRRPRIEEERLTLEWAKKSYKGVSEDKVRFGPHDLDGNLAESTEKLRKEGWREFPGIMDKLKSGDKIIRIRFQHEGTSFQGSGVDDWLIIIRKGEVQTDNSFPNIFDDDENGDDWMERQWEKRKRAKKLKL